MNLVNASLLRLTINPFMPTGAFNICCPRDCVSRHNGGTTGSPLIPRDAVSRTANVKRTVRHKWVKHLSLGSVNELGEWMRLQMNYAGQLRGVSPA